MKNHRDNLQFFENNASRAVGRGDWAEALSIYEIIITKFGPSDLINYNIALALIGSGRGQESLEYFEKCYKNNYLPKDFFVNYTYTLNSQGLYDRAAAVATEGLVQEGDEPALWINLGNAQRGTGNLSNAADSYRRALALDQSNLRYLYNLASVEIELGAHEAALKNLQMCLKKEPNLFEVNNNISVCHLKCGNLSEAKRYANKALGIRPNSREAHKNLGDILFAEKNFLDSLAAFRESLKIDPFYVSALRGLSQALYYLGRLTDALDSINIAANQDPDSIGVLLDRSRILNELRRYDEALVDIKRALEIDPNSTVALNNMGVAYGGLGRYADALEVLQRAVFLNDENPNAWNDLGGAQYRSGLINEAITSYDRAIVLDPEFSEAFFNKSQALLSRGEYLEGWRLYEWRWRSKGFPDRPRQYPQPLWLGERSLAGKRLFIFGEQGFGDSIQFCRYVDKCKELGAYVILQVFPTLTKLMKSLVGADHVISTTDPIPDFDFYCPMMSLPHAFRTTLQSIPLKTPYLSVDESSKLPWQRLLGEHSERLKIGVCWKGNPHQANDRNRSMPLDAIMPLLTRDHQWVCLQKDLTTDEKRTLQHLAVTVVAERLHSFYETAAIISTLDLVITVDTSVAHLAGALHKPVWVLLTRQADFRYMDNRTDSPWYPTMTLFRQVRSGQWMTVIQEVCKRLGQQKTRFTVVQQ